jgi:hypothetical protein
MQRPARCAMTAKHNSPSQLSIVVWLPIFHSSAFPGLRNTSSTMTETVRATCNHYYYSYSYRHRVRTRHVSLTHIFYSHSSPCRRFCFNTELSSCLRPETIHVGESCAQSGNRTRSCSCSRRGNACLVTITDANTIVPFHPCSGFRLLPYPGDCPFPGHRHWTSFGCDER